MNDKIQNLETRLAVLENLLRRSQLAYNSVGPLQISPEAVQVEHLSTSGKQLATVTTDGYLVIKTREGTTVKLATVA